MDYELDPILVPGLIAIVRPGRPIYLAETYHTADLFVQALLSPEPPQIEAPQPRLFFVQDQQQQQ